MIDLRLLIADNSRITTAFAAQSAFPFCLAVALLGSVGATVVRGQEAEQKSNPVVLLFDKTSGKLILRREDEASKFLSIDDLKDYLQERAELELQTMNEVCKLSDDQKSSLRAAIHYNDTFFLVAATKLYHEIKNNVDVQDGFPNYRFRNPLVQQAQHLNGFVRRNHFASANLAAKVVEGKLDDHQKKLLHEYNLQLAVDRIIQELNVRKEDRDTIVALTKEAASISSHPVLDPVEILAVIPRIRRTEVSAILGEKKSALLFKSAQKAIMEEYESASVLPPGSIVRVAQ